MKSQARNSAIDVARGITIALVVLGHSEIPEWLNDLFRPMRLPLFFLASGYLFSTSKYLYNFKSFIQSRFWRLIVPYFAVCAISYPYWMLTETVGISSGAKHSNALLGILYGGEAVFINFPLWFLPCLFSAEIIFWVIMRTTAKLSSNIQVLLFSAVSVVGFTLNTLINLPWSFDMAIQIQLFMFVGLRLKQLGLHSTFQFNTKLLLLCTALYTAIAFRMMHDNNILFYYIGGLSGSLLALQIAKMLSKANIIFKIFSLFGRQSLYILSFHIMAFSALRFAEMVLHVEPQHWSIRWFVGIFLSLLVGFVVSNTLIVMQKERKGGDNPDILSRYRQTLAQARYWR